MSSVGHFAKRVLCNPVAWRSARRFMKPGSVVLTYHRVGPPDARFPSFPVSMFREQMEWLARHCRPIHANELVASFASAGRLPVLVTFDDAYRDYYEYAYPILKGLGIPAVNFAPTHFVEHGHPFWWDVVHAAAHSTRLTQVTLPWNPSTSFAMNDGGRARAIVACKERIKAMTAPRDTTLDQILRAFGVDERSLAIERQVMTWEELRKIADVTEVGGHSHTHPLMSHLDTPELETEVGACRDLITARLGARPRLFAYPSGAFSAKAKTVVGAQGFELAFSTMPGRNHIAADRYELRRISAPRSLGELAWRLATSS